MPLLTRLMAMYCLHLRIYAVTSTMSVMGSFCRLWNAVERYLVAGLGISSSWFEHTQVTYSHINSFMLLFSLSIFKDIGKLRKAAYL
jgi:hypothetical protein